MHRLISHQLKRQAVSWSSNLSYLMFCRSYLHTWYATWWFYIAETVAHTQHAHHAHSDVTWSTFILRFVLSECERSFCNLVQFWRKCQCLIMNIQLNFNFPWKKSYKNVCVCCHWQFLERKKSNRQVTLLKNWKLGMKIAIGASLHTTLDTEKKRQF